MPACASTRAAPGARPAISTCGRRARRRISIECVEWAGTQPWSNGKVGINGISYYAMNQWQVARAQPAASRRAVHLGRLVRLLPRAVPPRRHPLRLPVELVSAPGRERAARRGRTRRQKRGHRRAGRRTADADRGGTGESTRRLRRRGAAPSPDRRLLPRAHGGVRQHRRRRCCRRRTGAAWACIRAAISKAVCAPAPGRNGWRCTATPTSRISTATTARTLQKRFFGHFLKGENTGWERQPQVSLNVRHPGEKFVLRAENEWPLARTQWTKFFLQPDGLGLGTRAARRRDDAEL